MIVNVTREKKLMDEQNAFEIVSHVSDRGASGSWAARLAGGLERLLVGVYTTLGAADTRHDALAMKQY